MSDCHIVMCLMSLVLLSEVLDGLSLLLK